MLRRRGRIASGVLIAVIIPGMLALGGDTSASPNQVASDGSRLGNITWISPRPDGLAAAGGFSSGQGISGDGRYVVFASSATNIVTGPAPAHGQAYIRDAVEGITRRISVAPDGAAANGATFPLSLSRDGRWALLSSDATNLADGDPPGYDLFLADTVDGGIHPIPRGGATGEVSSATMDGAGRLVAFVLLGGRGTSAVMLHDRESGGTEQVAAVPNLQPPGAIDGIHLALSGDGRWLTFSSDGPAGVHVGHGLRPWLLDTETGIHRGLPFPAGIIGEPRAVPAAISHDGSRILVVGGSAAWDGTNTAPSLYLFDATEEAYSPVPIPARPSGFPQAVYHGVLSPDGRLVAFFALVGNPYPEGASEIEGMVLIDTETGESSQPLRTFLGHRLSSAAIPWAFSADNRFLLFSSDVNYIHPADHNGASDAYLFELDGELPSFPFRAIAPGIAWGESPFVSY